MVLLVMILTFGVFVLIGHTIFYSFYGLWQLNRYFFRYNIKRSKRTLIPIHSAILERSFPYYQKLTAKEKKLFQKRLRYFVDSKVFIPKKMQRVTGEMKVLIGACAVQLTFGLPPLRLMYFKQILIYPEKYESLSGNIHKGEVNPKHHLIVLSWKDFVKGYAEPNSGYNVGLHEFAHALKIEDSIRNGEYNFFNTKFIAELHREFTKQQMKIKEGNHSILRKYAGTNFDEFFAVCIEYFFEKPEELYNSESGLYTTLSLMLKQNPLNK